MGLLSLSSWFCIVLEYLRQSIWPCRIFFRKLLNWTSDEDDFSADESSSEETGDFLSANPLIAATPEYSSKAFLHGGTPSKRASDLRLLAASWNVAGKRPSSDFNLREWLCVEPAADLYVIGFQEVVPLTAWNVLGPEDVTYAQMWETLIRRALNKESADSKHKQTIANPGSSGGEEELPLVTSGKCTAEYEYARVVSKQMVGLFITVWSRRALRHSVSNVKVSCVGCGLLGYLGNKGAVSVSLLVDETSFCFVCSHLASGGTERDKLRRNSDAMEILRRTSFSRPAGLKQAGTIVAHERVIWLGDLNYRLSASASETLALVERKDWESLLELDELRMEQSAGRAFQCWREGGIEFPPTYKYISGSDSYTPDDGRGRSPAWCDRILWLGSGLNQIAYTRTEYRLSDHRPISAIFEAEVEVA